MHWRRSPWQALGGLTELLQEPAPAAAGRTGSRTELHPAAVPGATHVTGTDEVCTSVLLSAGCVAPRPVTATEITESGDVGARSVTGTVQMEGMAAAQHARDGQDLRPRRCPEARSGNMLHH